MPRKGENIYKRKDGRWEGRFIKQRTSDVAKYGYIYGKSYLEVKKKLEFEKVQCYQEANVQKVVEQEAFVNAYILDSLKQSNIGKAITASISSSIVILVFMYAMDLQYGGVNNVLSDVMQSFSGIAGIIIVLMGIYFIVKSITTKRKK